MKKPVAVGFLGVFPLTTGLPENVGVTRLELALAYLLRPENTPFLRSVANFPQTFPKYNRSIFVLLQIHFYVMYTVDLFLMDVVVNSLHIRRNFVPCVAVVIDDFYHFIMQHIHVP